MKLTAVIILAACLQVTAAGYGQKISLTEKDSPIEKVLKKIQQQTSYRFLYTSQLLEGTPKVSIAVKNASIEEVLDMCFKGQKLDYEINENTIIIRPRRELPGSGVSQAKVEGPIDVRGVITDENGAPAQGVNITVKGTNRGTTTNLRGEFVLNGIDENAVLLISSVGYDRQEISVKGKQLITMQLRVAVGNLDEMQVIAYGKTSKRFQTGNVTTVKAEDIEKQPVNNPLLALEGRVPGLVVTQSTGLPGAGITVRIQGQNSIFYGSDPLYVIDGVPYFSQIPSVVNGILGSSNGLVQGSGGNPLSFINPADIESIEVLKDADATSIYGSRAANGAILITTKKGKAGATKVDFNLQVGFSKVNRNLKLLNTQQYLEMRHEAINNDGVGLNPNNDYDLLLWDTTRYTDWQKVLIGNTAKYSNFQVNVSGGSTSTQFLIGAAYNKQTTVFPGPFGDQKGSVHFNINNISTNQKFNIQLSGIYQIDNNKLSKRNLISDALQIPPNAPELYNSDGTLNWAPTQSGASTWQNPLAYLYQKYNNKTTNLISNGIISYKVLPGFELRTSLGYNNFKSDEVETTPLSSIKPETRVNNSNSSLFGNNTISTWIVEPQVAYKKNKIAGGDLEVLIGATIQQSNTVGKQFYGNGFSSEQVMEDIRSASTFTVLSTISTKYKYNAIFGRINYNWEDKYIINLTARRDGSSRFGSENQFHNFASVGAGWVFSKEPLFEKKSSIISFGKIKASYGTTGNDQIGDYSFMSLYSPVSGQPYQGIVGLSANRLVNPYLQWEETKKIQVGLDLGFLKDRILFNGNYFRNRSSNQLMGYAVPIITGFSGISSNFPATVQNSGWELTMNSINIKARNIKWSSGINITISKNSLISFANLESSSYAGSFLVGHPVTVVRSYQFSGVNETTGLYEYVAQDGSLTSSPQYLDQTNLINTAPTMYGGFQNNIQYKGFQLDFLFQFVKQKGQNYFYGIYPGAYFGGSNFGNQPDYVMRRWQKPGDISVIQKFSSSFSTKAATAFGGIQYSDASRKDASYVRLKNISLSWDLPKRFQSKAHVNECRFFMLGQNVFTITNFKGIDPEAGGYILSLPPLRVFTFGMQVTL